MLYDPKWEQQTKAKPFSREHVIAWLEAQDPRATYCYTDNGHCLIARYLTFLGHKNVSVGPMGYYDTDQTGERRGGFGNERAPGFLHRAAINQPHTFGAALERVRRAAIK